MMAFCPHCGSWNDDNATVCSNQYCQKPLPAAGKDGTEGKEGNDGKDGKTVAIVILVVLVIVGLIAGGIAVAKHLGNNSNDPVPDDPVPGVVTPETEDVSLFDMDVLYDEFVSSSVKYSENFNTGDTAETWMRGIYPYCMISYALGGNYDSLTATWGIADFGKNADGENGFEVYVDNELVYTSSTIQRGDLPEAVDIPLNYGNLLTIIFTEGEGNAILGDPVLHCSDISLQRHESPSQPPVWLTSLDYLSNDYVTTTTEANSSNVGTGYSHYMFANAYDEPQSITYYLKGQYSTLSGQWAICQQNRDAEYDSSFSIYADDNRVYSSPSIAKGDYPETFSVDINNCTELTIVFESGSGEAELGNLILWE